MFRGLKNTLQKWQDANLLTASQAEAIFAFEQSRKSGNLIKSLTKVAVIAILLGIASLVASNWSQIPAHIKLIIHFILNLGVMVYFFTLNPTTRPISREACLLGLFGLNLTLIALIGQTFQLHGDIHTTLILWLGISTPFLWYFGRSYLTILPWLMAVITTLYLNIDYYASSNTNFVAILTAFYLPILLLLIAGQSWLRIHRAGFVKSFERIGLFLPALFSYIAICSIYWGDRDFENYTLLIIGLACGLTIIFFAFRAQRDLMMYLFLSGLFFMVPFVFPDFESDITSALLFILYSGYLAWLGARIGSNTLTDWGIRLIILRLFIVYLEVFGSMVATGFGLILSGIILLILLRNLNKITALGRKLVTYEIPTSIR
jgi:uncharacterized membrane protein